VVVHSPRRVVSRARAVVVEVVAAVVVVRRLRISVIFLSSIATRTVFPS
jgi:hypothetical protein